MLNIILWFLFGFVIGFGLMWYYWRRYHTTDVFKAEVEQRAKELAQTLKKK